MASYRVVQTDNFNRENVSEKWALPYSFLEPDAIHMAKTLMRIMNPSGQNDLYFKVVPYEYELYEFKP